MTADEVRDLLRQDIPKVGRQKEYARVVGVSEAFLSAVLTGNKEPSGKLIARLSLQRVVSYEPVTA